MRTFLIALLVLLMLILGWLYRRDYNQCCASASTASEVVTNTVVEKSGPILFNWSKTGPILGDGWPSMRDSLSKSIAGDNRKFEITGWYHTNLTPPETDSIGFARAAEVRKLFPEIADENIMLLAKEMSGDSTYLSQKFESVSFGSRIQTESIKETEDKTLIYFPFNSTAKLNSKEVENYLNDVAERVLKSGESIVLSGHTDNIGDDASNITLGQKRANIVSNYLISKGVPANKITTTSSGESSPIADNSSESGRAKNRRTELSIVK